MAGSKVILGTITFGKCIALKNCENNTMTLIPLGCFSKDQVYLDGILQILRYRESIDFHLLMALGKVSGINLRTEAIVVSF